MAKTNQETTDSVRALKHCLEYLAAEARELGVQEVAQLIELASLAAEDAAKPLH